MKAIYFLAGAIAGLAIGWYFTKLHHEGKQENRSDAPNSSKNKNNG